LNRLRRNRAVGRFSFQIVPYLSVLAEIPAFPLAYARFMSRFIDLKNGFRQITADRHWLVKVLLGGFLLINPFLLALIPAFVQNWLNPEAIIAPWVQPAFFALLAFNVVTFWFPLGFTYEVLRRARTGRGSQLPDWSLRLLPRYAKEGAVKLVLAVFTLLLPVALWMGMCDLVFVETLGLPSSMLGMMVPPVMLFVIPFCGVACCRWLDGASVLSCALNYRENIRLFRKGMPDYLLASAFLVGINAITTAFFYTIPFAAVFGLCLVDTWFGPIYAESVKENESGSARPRHSGSTALVNGAR
jgi:hypothetical protein